MTSLPLLLPRPRRVEVLPGALSAHPGRARAIEAGPGLDFIAGLVSEDLAALPPPEDETQFLPELKIKISIDAGMGLPPQGYRLRVERNAVEIAGADAAGCFYGAMTLRQCLRAIFTDGVAACFFAEDWPDFERRAVLFDVSRDKIPTMSGLRAMIEKFAELKFNELQLYFEHAFAYVRHPAPSASASPFTAEEIRALDAFCRERFIDLVPNQNCFGHMERWLAHEPYARLAECADGWRHPLEPNRLRPPGVLCPADPGSIKLIDELLGELLLNFTSEMVNVGCDETFELGQGRSRGEVEKRGLGRVYLDYLKEVHNLAARRGRRMMFWGDILLEHPELIPELPKDAVALAWGYEADHPFATDLPKFESAGVEFYAVAGTSAWNSIAGRWTNARANIACAAREGLRCGARGLMIADWGDNGHIQHWPFSWPGFALGAALAWDYESNAEFAADVGAIPRALDAHVFLDNGGVAGRMVCELGEVYLETGPPLHNTTLLHMLMLKPELNPLHDEFAGQIPPEDLPAKLAAARAMLDRHSTQFSRLKTRLTEPLQLRDEIINAGALLRHACRLGVARAGAAGGAIENIEAGERAMLALDLKVILAVYKRLWNLRNRPGGLEDSAGRLEKLLALYEGR